MNVAECCGNKPRPHDRILLQSNTKYLIIKLISPHLYEFQDENILLIKHCYHLFLKRRKENVKKKKKTLLDKSGCIPDIFTCWEFCSASLKLRKTLAWDFSVSYCLEMFFVLLYSCVLLVCIKLCSHSFFEMNEFIYLWGVALLIAALMALKSLQKTAMNKVFLLQGSKACSCLFESVLAVCLHSNVSPLYDFCLISHWRGGRGQR